MNVQRMRKPWQMLLGALEVIAITVLPLPLTASGTDEGDVPKFHFDASLRARTELVDWLGTPESNHRYDFSNTKLLFGGRYDQDWLQIRAQGEYFQLYSLPSKATGPGAVYSGTNGGEENPGSVSLRQLFVRTEDEALTATLGRFLYSNGSEALPQSERLKSLRLRRVSQRLIGPFDFTAGRSFDGGQLGLPFDWGTITGLFVMPTQGGFESDLNRTIDEIEVGAISWTAPFASDMESERDFQLFVYHYSDGRDVLKVDNRPADLLTSDREHVDIRSYGGHWIELWPGRTVSGNGLFWGALQEGDFGSERHRAFSCTAELGLVLESASWKPELRLGYTLGSGDSDPLDGEHETFFQLLPTARAYATSPFYNMQNMADLFLQLTVKPTTELSLRGEFHRLELAENHDLLYSGGGANERRHRFGYSGLPSGGSHEVGLLLDLEATWKLSSSLAFTLYYGHLFGGDVAEAVAAGGRSDLDYLFGELIVSLGV